MKSSIDFRAACRRLRSPYTQHTHTLAPASAAAAAANPLAPAPKEGEIPCAASIFDSCCCCFYTCIHILIYIYVLAYMRGYIGTLYAYICGRVSCSGARVVASVAVRMCIRASVLMRVCVMWEEVFFFFRLNLSISISISEIICVNCFVKRLLG